MNKIIDVVMFGGEHELPMLLARLEYLKDVVDLTVILEANVSHNDQEIGLFLEKAMSEENILFADYDILYCPVRDLPRGGSNWDRVINHRNASRRHLGAIGALFSIYSGTDPHSIMVMTSDLDEIPMLHLVKEIKEEQTDRARIWVSRINSGHVGAFAGEMYYYHPLFFSVAAWRGPRVTSLGSLWKKTPQGCRNDVDFDIPKEFRDMPNIGNPLAEEEEIGANHFSYFGGSDLATIARAVQRKVVSIAEGFEYAEKFGDERELARKIAEGKDPYDRTDQIFHTLTEPRRHVPKLFLERFSLNGRD